MRKFDNIVIVDDDDTFRFLFKESIKKSEIAETIISFNDAEEALEYLKDNHLNDSKNLIFLDIKMPYMDGWQFLDEYSKLTGINRNNLIIMLSSSVYPHDEKKARDHQLVYKYLKKPINSADLRNLAHELN